MFNQIYHNIIEEGRKRKLKYKKKNGINTYDSVADAALKSNISSGAIVQRCKTKKI